MDLIITDTSFNTIAVIDEYESLLWTDRYNKAGDFELYLSAHSPYMAFLQKDNYCFIEDSEYVMIIEGIEIRTDSEAGDRAVITGRSLESILDRRIVWSQTTFTNKSLRHIVNKLITKNVINTGSNDRNIPNFRLGSSFTTKDNPIIDDSTNEDISDIDVQYTGDNVYSVITEICDAFNVGFKITLEDVENEGVILKNQFVFELYTGADRTYDQSDNPYVMFSHRFDNIINSDYLESNKTLKNVTLILGEGEGKNRKKQTYPASNAPSGLTRREFFTDARDISSEYTDEEGVEHTLTTNQYNKALRQRGKEKLTENRMTKAFDGEVESTVLFKYGRDFFMGDIIQIENDFGIAGKARITEYIRSQDKNGISLYPTFTAINEEQ